MGLAPFKRASAPPGAEAPEAPLKISAKYGTGPEGRSWRPRAVFLFGLLFAILILVAGCTTGKQSTWDPVGPVADKQLQMFNVLLWTMVVVFVLVEGVLLYAIVRYRRQPGREPSRTHGHLNPRDYLDRHSYRIGPGSRHLVGVCPLRP